MTLVNGGKEANGNPLFIARAEYEGGWHTCKAAEHLPAAQLAFSGKEVTIQVRARSMLWLTRSVSDILVIGV